MTDAPDIASFPFRFDSLFRRVGMVFGVRPATAKVEVVGPHLVARMGPWSVVTSISSGGAG